MQTPSQFVLAFPPFPPSRAPLEEWQWPQQVNRCPATWRHLASLSTTSVTCPVTPDQAQCRWQCLPMHWQVISNILATPNMPYEARQSFLLKYKCNKKVDWFNLSPKMGKYGVKSLVIFQQFLCMLLFPIISDIIHRCHAYQSDLKMGKARQKGTNWFRKGADSSLKSEGWWQIALV